MTTATKRKAQQNGTAPVKARKLCILGYAEESRDMVFGLGPDVEVWGINMAHAFTFKQKEGKWLPRDAFKARSTDWFQLHPRDWAAAGKTKTGYFGRPKEHLDFLQQFEGTVWLQKADPEIPNAKVFPLQEIAQAAGRAHFTSTFAYQLGLMWYQIAVENNPVSELFIYGVNLTSLDEYIHQKPCVEYWLGRLEQLGVKLTIPDASGLLKGRLYAQAESDMSDHAFTRLQHAKEEYGKEYANFMVGETGRLDTEYWGNKIREWAVQFPDSFSNPEFIEAIQIAVGKRSATFTQMSQRGFAGLNSISGRIQTEQHWLALTGGVDHRATQLMEFRSPSPAIAGELDLPEAKAI